MPTSMVRFRFALLRMLWPTSIGPIFTKAIRHGASFVIRHGAFHESDTMRAQRGGGNGCEP